ncbi:MAG: zinc ABC transporter substrate-binding protein [Actinobacteria bacterium]|nr:MAG: zinc ABC transporter substrate-binding protein [Actinomycetota bacterium]
MQGILDKCRVRATCYAVAVLAGMLALVLSAGCGTGGKNDPGRMKVAADIVPMADFCREVGGDMVDVEVMVPPGASPHTYELTTGQMRFLAEADVLATVGLGLSPWAEGIFANTDNPDMILVVAGEAIPRSLLVRAGETHEGAQDEESAGEEGQEYDSYDPHVWLDPELAVYMIVAIRDGYMEADPENAEVYRGNAARYIEELEELDREIGEELVSVSNRKFVSFHSSWTYFARRYGLEQVGVIEEQPGKEPSVGEIAALVEGMESQGVKVVFAEPQFNPRAAEAIAEESGGEVVVEILDPLGDPNHAAADTYLEMMRQNVAVIMEALK